MWKCGSENNKQKLPVSIIIYTCWVDMSRLNEKMVAFPILVVYYVFVYWI
jgi:hypothetical protein